MDETLDYRKESANGNADYLSRLPQPATEHDRGGSSRLTPADDEAIYLVGGCGLLTPSTSVPGIGLGGLVPQPDSAALGGLPLTSTDFCDFRTHGPRMRIDDLSVSTGRFVARVSAFVLLVMTASAARHFGLPPTPLSLRFSRCPPGLLRQTYPRGPLRPHRRLQWHCRLRAVSPLGRAEEQPLRPAPRSLPLTVVRTRQGSADVFFSGRPSAARFASSAAFGCHPERISSPNACPDGTHPVRPRSRGAFGSPLFRALYPF